MSVVPPLSGTPLYRYIPGVGRVAAVQCGTSVTPLYGSFLSSTTQPVTVTNPVAITLSERTLGSIDVLGGTYPESQVVIPTTGTYRCMFSAQCDSSSGTHYLEIFPVVNGIPVPDSNTRIRVSAAGSGERVEQFPTDRAADAKNARVEVRVLDEIAAPREPLRPMAQAADGSH